MKRIPIVIAGIMAAFTLTACSADLETIEGLLSTSSEYNDQIAQIEEDLAASAYGVVDNVDIGFEGNTIVLTYDLAFELTPEIMDSAAIEESLNVDGVITSGIEELAGGIGVDPGDISVQVIMRNPDGSEYVNVVL